MTNGLMLKASLPVVAVLLSLFVAPTSVVADVQGDFLHSYCLRCHGAEMQKADRRFDRLSASIETLDDLELWQEIVDQLNLGEMPPEDAPQPTQAERLAAVQSITAAIEAARVRLHATGRHTVMRRLNTFEYQQTIGDLFGLNVQAWNPAADFPPEVKVDGFDNNGAELVTSGMLLDHYLIAAEEVVRRATRFESRPQSQLYTQASPFYFEGNEGNDLPKLFQVDRFRYIPDVPYTDLTGRHYRGGHIGFRPLHPQGVLHSGVYTIRVRAAAVDRHHSYGQALDDFRNGDPLVLEVAAVTRAGSVKSTGNISTERTVASAELTSDEPQWFEWDVTLQQGDEPEVRFANGTSATKRLIRLLMSTVDEHEHLQPFADLPPGNERSYGVLKVYRGPKLRIWEIQVEGPHIAEWPPRGHSLLYGDLQPSDLNAETIHARLHQFATTVFRRPLRDGELRSVNGLIRHKLAAGVDPLTAYQLGCQTILCSPGFLYLREGEGPLDDYALASRLSYFLWSSMPDEELLTLAADGRLRDPLALSGQVDRMLVDAKSERFVSNFVRRWLDLDSIGEMPPSPDFVSYYRDHLDEAMRTETETFFRHVLDNNLHPREFLTADYTFVNRSLARHYGLTAVEGNQFRRISLAGTPRGGLIGHGSFLTASANGVDTSPVVRGIYMLEKLLAYRPPPPPPDVPEIEPDIRGATTIREQLERHREVATCAECHRKIDPFGFALENFDAIGGWREEYGKNLPIDASGIMPTGESFTTLPEFRQLLMNQEDQFTRCLTEKLLTYALGRQPTLTDRPRIDAILTQMKHPNRGLLDLVKLIVVSESFGEN